MEGVPIKKIRAGDFIVLEVKRVFYPLGSSHVVCLEFDVPIPLEPMGNSGGHLLMNEDEIITKTEGGR